MRRRFWSKVDVSAGATACWPWTASLQPSGYGQFFYNGRPVRATRALWDMYKGPIPEGLGVLHTCDNRRCVNPTHLYLGTHQQNMQDLVDRNRHATKNGYVPKGRPLATHCKHGHPFDEANTYIAQGHRYCRICQATRVKEWKFAHRNRRSKPDQALLASAAQLIQEGLSIRKAASIVGTTHTSLRRWLEQGKLSDHLSGHDSGVSLKGTTFTGVIN